MRNWLGDQGRKASADGKESLVLRNHDRVLEFDGCDLFRRSMDIVGHAKLRQGPAPTGDGHRTRCGTGEVSQCEGGKRISGHLTLNSCLCPGRYHGSQKFLQMVSGSVSELDKEPTPRSRFETIGRGRVQQ